MESKEYCKDEAIDYDWLIEFKLVHRGRTAAKNVLSMINFSSRTNYFISSSPTDMRKGHEGLADIVRLSMNHNPLDYNVYIIYFTSFKKQKYKK